MTQFTLDDLLSDLAVQKKLVDRPWGFMRSISSVKQNLTVKYICAHSGERTSLQKHVFKDELIFIINGTGFVEVDGVRYEGYATTVRVKPGQVHRVTGPLVYLEVSSYDDGKDTIRLEDDYGRD